MFGLNKQSIFSVKEPTLTQLLAEPTVNGKYDLSKWKYSQLRDIINTSCDIKLLEVSQNTGLIKKKLQVEHSLT